MFSSPLNRELEFQSTLVARLRASRRRHPSTVMVDSGCRHARDTNRSNGVAPVDAPPAALVLEQRPP